MSTPQSRRGENAEEHTPLERGASLAAFLKAALFTCFFAATAYGCVALLIQSRYAQEYMLSASLVPFGWFLGKWRWKRAWERLRVLAVLWTGFFAGWTWFSCLGPERDELEQEGNGLIVCVEDFHARSGRYPSTLVEAGCAPHWNRFGGWLYEVPSDGTDYQFRVGDYGKDGFILYRDSTTDTWAWDT